jgi:hypothetical protein
MMKHLLQDRFFSFSSLIGLLLHSEIEAPGGPKSKSERDDKKETQIKPCPKRFP